MRNQEIFNRLIKTMPNGTTNTMDFMLEKIGELEQQLAECRANLEKNDCLPVPMSEWQKMEQQLAEAQKQIVMLREVVVIAAQRGDLFEHDQAQAEAALAATDDLSGLVLCDAEPVAYVVGDVRGNFGALLVGMEPSTKLYKARKP
jgi:hypothetical protein